MKRIGYFVSVVGIAFVLITSYAVKNTFAASCCEKKDPSCCAKEASAAEKSETKCVVCGKALDKDKGVKVECEGKTVTLCCNDCATVFKKNPSKFSKDEKCCEKHEEHEEHHEEHHHEEGHH